MADIDEATENPTPQAAGKLPDGIKHPLHSIISRQRDLLADEARANLDKEALQGLETVANELSAASAEMKKAQESLMDALDNEGTPLNKKLTFLLKAQTTPDEEKRKEALKQTKEFITLCEDAYLELFSASMEADALVNAYHNIRNAIAASELIKLAEAEQGVALDSPDFTHAQDKLTQFQSQPLEITRAMLDSVTKVTTDRKLPEVMGKLLTETGQVLPGVTLHGGKAIVPGYSLDRCHKLSTGIQQLLELNPQIVTAQGVGR